jgi:hypothetical protein
MRRISIVLLFCLGAVSFGQNQIAAPSQACAPRAGTSVTVERRAGAPPDANCTPLTNIDGEYGILKQRRFRHGRVQRCNWHVRMRESTADFNCYLDHF